MREHNRRSFVWVNRNTPVLEPFFRDVELKLKLFGGSVISRAGGVEESVVGEECSMAFGVSRHVVDVDAKEMWCETRALRHSCKNFARGGMFAFYLYVKASVSEKGAQDGNKVVGNCEVDQFADEAVVPNFVEGLFHVEKDCCGIFSKI